MSRRQELETARLDYLADCLSMFDTDSLTKIAQTVLREIAGGLTEVVATRHAVAQRLADEGLIHIQPFPNSTVVARVRPLHAYADVQTYELWATAYSWSAR